MSTERPWEILNADTGITCLQVSFCVWLKISLILIVFDENLFISYP